MEDPIVIPGTTIDAKLARLGELTNIITLIFHYLPLYRVTKVVWKRTKCSKK
jgi:hypothetical protein